ncbi:nuclear transport factor 2 family protein [Carboxylicivirga sp. M1479]|uniref:nuclear transport factor 2 family protein n=1 Tax=Carboxylicivirga sp. M1479 TaxID=2594476 RepID=UPI00163DE5B2|nr:nuclear transport factor 2 family protein [Carboxylicivirga sp. M1479]
MKRKNVVYKNLIYPLIFGLMFSTISCLNADKNNEFVEDGVQKKELQNVTSEIKKQNKRFEKFYLNGHADSLGLVFDKNVKQYISHQSPTKNLDELIKNSKLQMSWGKWDFVISTEEVKLSGQMAVERGKYQFSFTPNEQSPIPAQIDSGNYIAVWEKFDETWKIVWDAPVTELPLQ